MKRTIRNTVAILLSMGLSSQAYAYDLNMAFMYGGTNYQYEEYADRTQQMIDIALPDSLELTKEGNLKTNRLSKEFVTDMHNKNMKVIPFLSNYWDRNLGIAALNNTENLCNELVRAVEEYQLDGINIDLNNLTDQHKQHYVNLVKYLKSKLPNAIVSVSVAPNPHNETTGWYGSYDYKQLTEIADCVILMCYDESYHNSAPGPVASKQFVEDSIKNLLNYTTGDKVILGIPFYGRYWKMNEQTGGKGITNMDIKSLMDHYKSTKSFDEEHQASKVTVTIEPNDPPAKIWGGATLSPGQYEIWYDDVNTTLEKMKLADDYGLKGVASWALGQEDEAIWSLYANQNQSLNDTQAYATEESAPPVSQPPQAQAQSESPAPTEKKDSIRRLWSSEETYDENNQPIRREMIIIEYSPEGTPSTSIQQTIEGATTRNIAQPSMQSLEDKNSLSVQQPSSVYENIYNYAPATETPGVTNNTNESLGTTIGTTNQMGVTPGIQSESAGTGVTNATGIFPNTVAPAGTNNPTVGSYNAAETVPNNLTPAAVNDVMSGTGVTTNAMAPVGANNPVAGSNNTTGTATIPNTVGPASTNNPATGTNNTTGTTTNTVAPAAAYNANTVAPVGTYNSNTGTNNTTGTTNTSAPAAAYNANTTTNTAGTTNNANTLAPAGTFNAATGANNTAGTTNTSAPAAAYNANTGNTTTNTTGTTNNANTLAPAGTFNAATGANNTTGTTTNTVAPAAAYNATTGNNTTNTADTTNSTNTLGTYNPATGTVSTTNTNTNMVTPSTTNNASTGNNTTNRTPQSSVYNATTGTQGNMPTTQQQPPAPIGTQNATTEGAVPRTNPAEENRNSIYKNKVLNKGWVTEAEYNASKDVTRSQALKTILRLIPNGGQSQGIKEIYADIQNHPDKSTIERANQFGLTDHSDTMFHPDQTISKGELAVLLDKIINYPNTVNFNSDDVVDVPFDSNPEIYYAVNKLVQHGIFVLDDANRFYPDQKVTMKDFMDVLNKLEGAPIKELEPIPYNNNMVNEKIMEPR